MKLIVQRVTKAKVSVDEKRVGQIDKGYFVLVGIGQDDNEETIQQMAEKLIHLRVMADENGKINLNIKDAGGSILLVSQFTLYADTSQRRPSFIKAAKPEKACMLFDKFVQEIRDKDVPVKTGIFGAYMQIESVADGPVTIILEN